MLLSDFRKHVHPCTIIFATTTKESGPRSSFVRADKQIWATGGCDTIILSPLCDVLFIEQVIGALLLKQGLVPADLSQVGCSSFPFLAYM